MWKENASLYEQHIFVNTSWISSSFPDKHLPSILQIKAFETVSQLFWLNSWWSKVWQSNYLQNPIDQSPHV